MQTSFQTVNQQDLQHTIHLHSFPELERNFFSTDSQLRDIGSKNLQSVDPKTHRGDKPKLILTPVVKNNIFLFFFFLYGWQIQPFVCKQN